MQCARRFVFGKDDAPTFVVNSLMVPGHLRSVIGFNRSRKDDQETLPISGHVAVSFFPHKHEIINPPHVRAERSQRSNSSMPTRKHILFTHYLEDPTCAVSEVTKIARAQCRHQLDARSGLCTSRQHSCRYHLCGPSLQSTDRVEVAVSTRCGCAGLTHQSYPTKTKSAQDTKKCLQ